MSRHKEVLCGASWAATTPRPITGLFRSLLQGGRIVEQHPFDNRQRETSVFDQVIVELTELEIVALSVLVTAEQIHDL
jgi:hypothetical protein